MGPGRGHRVKKRRVYHFCNREFGLENLRKRRVKVSTFDSLNDPFEMLCHNAGDEALRRRLQAFKADVSSKNGIICFSRERTSPVQWAHYADRHTGICLGFDVPADFAMDVVYTGKRLKFEYDPSSWDSSPNSPGYQAMLTKYKHWSYEKEVRLFGDLGIPDPENGLYFQYFGLHLELKEVAVGYKSEVSRHDLDDHLGDLISQVDSYKVRPAFNSFRMVRNRDDTLWQ